MVHKPRHVANMLDLRWPYKRHSEIFAGVQRYVVGELVDDRHPPAFLGIGLQ